MILSFIYKQKVDKTFRIYYNRVIFMRAKEERHAFR
jgi:hypothetical protein